MPAQQWAVECSAQEAALIEHPNSFLRYRMRIVDEKGEHVRDEIETPEGSVARLIERNGRPLTAEEDQAERARLQALVESPTTFAHHIKSEEANRKIGLDMLKLLPAAMVWSYAPGQPQPTGWSGKPEDSLIVIDFAPNPSWKPPSLTAEALTGLAGRAWVDPRARQVVRIEGRLVKPVNIGWGMIAHLYPGATIAITQRPVGGERWVADHIEEQLVARALVVKTIRQNTSFTMSGCEPVPSMPYQQAIRMLLDTPLEQHALR